MAYYDKRSGERKGGNTGSNRGNFESDRGSRSSGQFNRSKDDRRSRDDARGGYKPRTDRATEGRGAGPRYASPPRQTVPNAARVDDPRRPVDDKRTYNGNRPASDHRPSMGNRRPISGQRSSADNRRPSGDPRPSYDNRRPSGDPRPSYDNRRPSGDPRPSYDNRRPAGDVRPSYEIMQPEMPENLLVGRNPIREALRAGVSIEKMLVTNGELVGSAREIVAMARDAGVIIQYVDRVRLDAIYPHHQGMLAFASAAEYAELEDILALAQSKGEQPFVVVLDGITDPHNLGAIIRSAECMGAHGVIIPERRSAGLNPAAVKASAGALSHVKVARVTNLTRALETLKEKGLWVTGAVMSGRPVDQCNLSGPIALVIGSEGEGISPLVTRQCDQLVALTMYGQIESLNASVAAGILLNEIAKARHGA